MGRGVRYSDVKTAEISNVAKDLATVQFGDHSRWNDIHFWVDKTCIPQGEPELMRWCVGLLEEFLVLSDGLVSMSWTYFERLWCVYEWACFLVFHGSESITLCASAVVRPTTLPHLLASIRDFLWPVASVLMSPIETS